MWMLGISKRKKWFETAHNWTIVYSTHLHTVKKENMLFLQEQLVFKEKSSCCQKNVLNSASKFWFYGTFLLIVLGDATYTVCTIVPASLSIFGYKRTHYSDYITLFEKIWRISLHVTDTAIAKLNQLIFLTVHSTIRRRCALGWCATTGAGSWKSPPSTPTSPFAATPCAPGDTWWPWRTMRSWLSSPFLSPYPNLFSLPEMNPCMSPLSYNPYRRWTLACLPCPSPPIGDESLHVSPSL